MKTENCKANPAQKVKQLLEGFGVKVYSARMTGMVGFSMTVAIEQKELAERLMFSMGVRYGMNKGTDFFFQTMNAVGSKTKRVADFNNLAIIGVRIEK